MAHWRWRRSVNHGKIVLYPVVYFAEKDPPEGNLDARLGLLSVRRRRQPDRDRARPQSHYRGQMGVDHVSISAVAPLFLRSVYGSAYILFLPITLASVVGRDREVSRNKHVEAI